MASNVVPSNSLKLVKICGDDPRAQTITSRMGMTVAEFMNTLGYSKPKTPQRTESKAIGFVWPKHTALEVRDPSESVYQYEPSDISWSLRFRALGCYNIVHEKPDGSYLSLRSGSALHPTPNNPVVANEVEGFAVRNPDHIGDDQIETLLTSRACSNADINPPLETITLAERHKLLEDLRLTDSEDEKDTDAPLNNGDASLPTPSSPMKTVHDLDLELGDTVELSSSRLPDNRLPNSTTNNAADDPFSKLNRNSLLRYSRTLQPPPYVSPLSVMGDDVLVGVEDPSYCSPPDEVVVPSKPADFVTGNIADGNSFLTDSSNNVAAIEPSKHSTEAESFNSQRSSVQLNYLESQSTKSPLTNGSSTQMKVTKPKVGAPGVPRYNRRQVGPSPIDQLNEPKICDTAVRNDDERRPVGNGLTRDVYVRRLLMESEAMLAAKQNCLVKGLSPHLLESWTPQRQASSPEKENVENKPASKPSLTSSNTAWPTEDRDNRRKSSILGTTPVEQQDKSVVPGHNSQIGCTLKSPNLSSNRRREFASQNEQQPHKSSNLSKDKGNFAGPDKEPVLNRVPANERMTVNQIPRQSSRTPDDPSSFKSHTPETVDVPVAPSAPESAAAAPPSSSPDHLQATTSDHIVVEKTNLDEEVSITNSDQSTVASGLDGVYHNKPDQVQGSALEKASLSKDSLVVGGADAKQGINEQEEPTVSSADRVSMPPPPAAESSSRRMNKRTSQNPPTTEQQRCESVTNATTAPANNSDAPDHERVGGGTKVSAPSSIEDNSLSSKNNLSSVPDAPQPSSKIVKNSAPTLSLREIPSKRWIFSDVALTKVRLKLQSVLHSQQNEHNSDIILEQLRSTLTSLMIPRESSTSTDSGISQGRRNRARALAGVLLIPPRTRLPPSLVPPKTLASDQAVGESIEKLCPSTVSAPERRDVFTLTSPVPDDRPTLVDMDVQCSIRFDEGSSRMDDLLSKTSVNSQSRSTESSMLVGDKRPAQIQKIAELRRRQLAAEEEERIQNSTAATELHLAEECKAKASRCWKALVSSVSSTQSGAHTGSANRYHMILGLDTLQEYPVHLIQGVRHLLAAAYLLEQSGESARAADVLTEASSQLDHISRRMRRVEGKLMKNRSKHYDQTCDQPVTDLVPAEASYLRAKRDAGWMHLWYYALSRIRSITSFREYQIRIQLCGSLFQCEVDEGLLRNKNSADVRLGSNSQSSGKNTTTKTVQSSDDGHPSSPNQFPKTNPSFIVNSHQPIPGTPNESVNHALPSPTDITVPSSTIDRFTRLVRLDKILHQATAEWREADKLLSEVPLLDSALYKQRTSSSSLSPSYPPIQSSSPIPGEDPVDADIALGADGAYLCGWQTRLGTLLRFIDGLISTHNLLLLQLKGFGSSEAPNTAHTSAEVDKINVPAKNNQTSPVRVNSTSCVTSCIPADTQSNTSVKSRASDSPGSSVKNPKRENLKTTEDGNRAKVKTSPVAPHKSASPSRTNSKPSSGNNPSKVSRTDAQERERKPKTEPKVVTTMAALPAKKAKKRRLISSDDHDGSENSNASMHLTPVVNGTYPDIESTSSTSTQLSTGQKASTERAFSTTKKPVKRIENEEDSSTSFTALPSKTTRKSTRTSASKKANEIYPSGGHLPSKGKHQYEEKSDLVETVSPLRLGKSVKLPQTTVFTGSLNGSVEGDTASPDYVPSSPSPVRSRRRSKSLAPTSHKNLTTKTDSLLSAHTHSSSRKKNVHSPIEDGWSEDNAYQPKRIRPSASKPRKPCSDSDSSSSPSSSPLPSYRPSVVSNMSDEKNIRRRMRSASVGRTLTKDPPPDASLRVTKVQDARSSLNCSSDSIGYSPTKHGLTNGKQKSVDSVSQVPVYHVSRISNSPTGAGSSAVPLPQIVDKPKPSQRPTTKTDVTQTPALNRTDNKKTVPSFYARWMNEPPSHSSGVPYKQPRRYHDTQSRNGQL
ncbi:unnamed protein product [Calicophoron daubneyi]|uniref:Uncharacterized protein n=1 Tax=Calicophoron daubneyi TaxID=300641 RepID=A0AAV2TFN4_CALDB